MSVRQRVADRYDARWEVCRRCRHYRVEHGAHAKACRAQVLREDGGDPDRCECSTFDPPT